MKILLCLFCLIFGLAFGQLNPQNGTIDSKATYYALKNATIIVSPTKTIQNGTLLIKNDDPKLVWRILIDFKTNNLLHSSKMQFHVYPSVLPNNLDVKVLKLHFWEKKKCATPSDIDRMCVSVLRSEPDKRVPTFHLFTFIRLNFLL